MNDLLRFATAGSVDDGKSTLIGRLLHDTKALFEDTLQAVAHTSARRGYEGLDLALVTDGLRAEREQGITIDVAYRYFATPRRTFIIADTPGHARYTRNMVTGASTADVAVILLDARAGLVEQTRRHAVIAATLGIPRVVLAVNKMDLVGWSEARFDELAEEFACFVDPLGLVSTTPIPLSALHGDNVVEPTHRSSWYAGPTLLAFLEEVPTARAEVSPLGARLPVQWVIRPRPGEADARRRYAGTLAAGRLRPGDAVVVLPSGDRTTVRSLDAAEEGLAEAEAGAAISVQLDDELDVGRGDLIAHADAPPAVTRQLEAAVCWFAERPLLPRARLLLQHTTRTTKAIAADLVDRVDVVTLERRPSPACLDMNDLGTVRLALAGPIAADEYAVNRASGSFILLDEATNDTVGAGMIRSLHA
jgi:sulfate adenylyltransferase large subunit